MDKNKRNKDIYWAAVDPKDIATEMMDKVESYYMYLAQSGRLDLYRRAWVYYYRPRLTQSALNPVGQQGELTSISVNHYRNLLTHLETMTLQQRVNFEPRAVNSDVKSQSQVILATGLLDYYLRIKRLEKFLKQQVKDGLMYAEGFLRTEWDATGGQTYGQSPTGALLYQGDIKYSNYDPLNCTRDYTKPTYDKRDWVILRDFVNKYDLAAKFPDLREKILNVSIDYLEQARTTVFNDLFYENTDLVPMYTLLHPPTPSLPQGRYTTCLDETTTMLDGPIPYDETHVSRLAPDEESGTIFGYTVGFDLLPIQQAIDIMYSTIITNQSTFGVQNILMPKGHDISTAQLSGGLNVVEYDPKVGKPEALQLTATAPETFNFIPMLEKVQQMIAGIDSVTRGDPSASLKSGSALALVAAQSIQFSMGLQQSYAQAVEDSGTSTINLLKTFASVPRVAEIAGKSNRPLMKQFTGDDLDAIQRVSVDMGNPMTRTTAGKVNLADALMEKDMIENPDQYIQVVTTGRLEPVIEGKQANLLLTKGENEQLSDGVPQRALITDYHAKHILEHSIVLANPEIRMDPNNPIVAVTLGHIQEHIDFLNSPGYQMMAASLGHQITVPPAVMGAPTPNGGGTGDMMNPNPPVQQAAEQVQQPQMPEPPDNTAPEDAATMEGVG